MRDPVQVNLGDEVQTRKKHPCGSDRWAVYRIGADIGLRCAGCGRLVLMPRSTFNKSVKKVFPSAVSPPSEASDAEGKS